MTGSVRLWPADLLTLANALCGTGAALVITSSAATGNPQAGLRRAVLLILAGTVCDVLDGAVAMRWGASEIGWLLDSLSDAVTFGVAPALVVVAHTRAVSSDPAMGGALVVAALVYVACALIRLADFSARHRNEPWFTGLPTPGAALSAVGVALLTPSPGWRAAGLLVVGILMVSRVRYPHPRGVVLVLSLTGWAYGAAGLLGWVDVRPPAALSVAFLLVVSPLVLRVQERRAATKGPPEVSAC